MMLKKNSEYERWLFTAEENLESAKTIRTNKVYPWTCYIAQQAAETALKAYLIFQGEELPRIHLVKELLENCGKYDKDFIANIDEYKELDAYYIPTRYPNGLSDGTPGTYYSASDADKAIKLADKIVSLVKRKVNI